MVKEQMNVSIRESPMMSLKELADFLRVHPSTVYRLMKKDRLPGFKLGRDWRYNQESIDRWMKEQEEKRNR
jgi:excisionase family DNA binding protein